MEEINIPVHETADQEKELKKLLDPSCMSILREFREKAAGSYNHSLNVSNILDLIAMELHLNPLEMRVLGLYHDIGKSVGDNSKYFVENQKDDNIHDVLPPEVSALYISRHVGDGVVLLLNCHEFPRFLIEAISQHHSNSLMKLFYEKAGKDANPETFRYHCPPAASIEAGCLLIVDVMESKSRGLFQAGKFDNVDKIVNETLTQIIDEGLLDDVVLKIGHLKILRKVLISELSGIYGSKRIDYDKDKEK